MQRFLFLFFCFKTFFSICTFLFYWKTLLFSTLTNYLILHKQILTKIAKKKSVQLAYLKQIFSLLVFFSSLNSSFNLYFFFFFHWLLPRQFNFWKVFYFVSIVSLAANILKQIKFRISLEWEEKIKWIEKANEFKWCYFIFSSLLFKVITKKKLCFGRIFRCDQIRELDDVISKRLNETEWSFSKNTSKNKKKAEKKEKTKIATNG